MSKKVRPLTRLKAEVKMLKESRDLYKSAYQALFKVIEEKGYMKMKNGKVEPITISFSDIYKQWKMK